MTGAFSLDTLLDSELVTEFQHDESSGGRERAGGRAAPRSGWGYLPVFLAVFFAAVLGEAFFVGFVALAAEVGFAVGEAFGFAFAASSASTSLRMEVVLTENDFARASNRSALRSVNSLTESSCEAAASMATTIAASAPISLSLAASFALPSHVNTSFSQSSNFASFVNPL